MSEAKESTFSFIIPVLNGEKYIQQCLSCIIAEMDSDDELIVVDNGSTDNTPAIVKGFEQVTLLERPGVTISTLRNQGAKAATKRHLAFIDSDCLVCSGWRKAAVEVLSDPSTSVTGSIYDLPESPAWVEKTWYSFRPMTQTDTHVLLGGNLVVDRQVFQAVGGFDEKLITDEDTEICLRLTANGYVLKEDPTIRVIHLGNPKTMRQFYRKVKWQSTSILNTMFKQKIDKPMARTLLFMLACCFLLVSLAALPFVRLPLVVATMLVLAIPLVTVLYRFWQYRYFRFFFQNWILFLIFYVARSVTVLKALIGKHDHDYGLTDEDRGK